MVLPGHLAGGYLATKVLLALTHASFSPTQTIILLIFGTLAGDFPDIDIALFYVYRVIFKKSSRSSHRDYITHAPIFWLVIATLISIVGLAFNSSFVEYLGFLTLIGSWTHLIFDSIEYGVRWLWPFSNRRFARRTAPAYNNPYAPGSIKFYWAFITKSYSRYVTFYVEIIVTAIALYTALL